MTAHLLNPFKFKPPSPYSQLTEGPIAFNYFVCTAWISPWRWWQWSDGGTGPSPNRPAHVLRYAAGCRSSARVEGSSRWASGRWRCRGWSSPGRPRSTVLRRKRHSSWTGHFWTRTFLLWGVSGSTRWHRHSRSWCCPCSVARDSLGGQESTTAAMRAFLRGSSRVNYVRCSKLWSNLS